MSPAAPGRRPPPASASSAWPEPDGLASAAALSKAGRDVGRGRFAVPRPLLACGAVTLVHGSSLSGLTEISYDVVAETVAARLDAGRVTGASIGPGTWPAALGRLDPLGAPDAPDLGLRPVKLLDPEKPP